MLAKFLNIECPLKSEQLVALTYLGAPKSLKQVVRHIGDGTKTQAFSLVEAMEALPADKAQDLASKTVAGLNILETSFGNRLVDELKRLVASGLRS